MTTCGRLLETAVAVVVALASTACRPDRTETPDEPDYYEATGTIVGIEGEHVLIDHEEIPGFMDAMTMTFPVSDPSLLEGLEASDRVDFRVAVEGASYRIDRIELVGLDERPAR